MRATAALAMAWTKLRSRLYDSIKQTLQPVTGEVFRYSISILSAYLNLSKAYTFANSILWD